MPGDLERSLHESSAAHAVDEAIAEDPDLDRWIKIDRQHYSTLLEVREAADSARDALKFVLDLGFDLDDPDDLIPMMKMKIGGAYSTVNAAIAKAREQEA